MMKKAIIIFVRNPELGKVKTRLAATLGHVKALSIYNELLLHTKEITQSLESDKFVFYNDAIEHDDLWNGQGFIKKLQSNKDLGDKMKQAFQQLFNEGYKKVLIIGSDCFELTSEFINDAFDLLDEKDMVIGPANDGGYYLLGMKKMQSFVFDNKDWSTETVYKETVKDILTHQLSYAALPILIDVDTENDWLKSKNKIV